MDNEQILLNLYKQQQYSETRSKIQVLFMIISGCRQCHRVSRVDSILHRLGVHRYVRWNSAVCSDHRIFSSDQANQTEHGLLYYAGVFLLYLYSSILVFNRNRRRRSICGNHHSGVHRHFIYW